MRVGTGFGAYSKKQSVLFVPPPGTQGLLNPNSVHSPIVGVGVTVGVLVTVGVFDGVNVFVAVGVGVRVGVGVSVGVGVGLGSAGNARICAA